MNVYDRGLMKNFWPLMSAISGHQITDMSMFYAEYKYTDHLLPHEDDLENRVIAFVYYLNRFRKTNLRLLYRLILQ